MDLALLQKLRFIKSNAMRLAQLVMPYHKHLVHKTNPDYVSLSLEDDCDKTGEGMVVVTFTSMFDGDNEEILELDLEDVISDVAVDTAFETAKHEFEAREKERKEKQLAVQAYEEGVKEERERKEYERLHAKFGKGNA